MAVFQYGMLVQGVTSTATAAGTTSLTSTSTQVQVFTGSTTQTIKLPSATGMAAGQFFEIYNQSTGVLTIQFQDATSFAANPTIQAGSTLVVKLLSNGTANGTWAVQTLPSTIPGILDFTSNIGINTTNPGGNGTSSSFSANRRYLGIKGTTLGGNVSFTSGAADANNTIGQLEALDLNNVTDADQRVAGINLTSSGVTANRRGGAISFQTKSDSASGLVTAMTIDRLQQINLSGGVAHFTNEKFSVLQALTTDVDAGGIMIKQTNTVNAAWTNNAAALYSQVVRTITTSQTDSAAVKAGFTSNYAFVVPTGQTLTATNSSTPVYTAFWIGGIGVSGGGTVNADVAGIYAQSDAAATGANKYGIYIDQYSGATNNWGVYVVNNQSFFGGTTTIQQGTSPILNIKYTSNSGTNTAEIRFLSNSPTFAANYAAIVGQQVSGTDQHMLKFITSSTAAPGTEKMRIDEAGKVGIGIAAASGQQLHVKAATNCSVRLEGGTAGSEAAVQFVGSTTQTNWKIGQNSATAGALEFMWSTAGGGTTFSNIAARFDSAGLFNMLTYAAVNDTASTASRFKITDTRTAVPGTVFGGSLITNYTQTVASGNSATHIANYFSTTKQVAANSSATLISFTIDNSNTQVATGVTDSGTLWGMNITTNRTVTGTTDAGTLSGTQIGLNISAGNAGTTGVSSVVYGMRVQGNWTTGTVSAYRGLYLPTANTGGTGPTVGNHFGIYQEDANALNYFNGNVGIGAVTDQTIGLYVKSSALISASQVGIMWNGSFSSAATTAGYGILSQGSIAAVAFTMGDYFGVNVQNPVKGAGSAITRVHGLFVADQTSGATNYGLRMQVSSGTNKYNLFLDGTAQNYLLGNLGIANVDTANGVANARNLVIGDSSSTANTGITILTNGGGSPGLNSIYFSRANGSNTGGSLVYTHAGAENLAFSAAATQIFHINGAGLFTDSGNVGIGVSSTSNKVDIRKSETSVTGIVNIQNTDATTSSDSLAALLLVKGSTTNTVGTNRFIAFNINAGGTGSGYIASNGANAVNFAVSSDRRLKKNIADLTGGLDTIMALQPRTFDWKDNNESAIGFIAQELAEVIPKQVYKSDDGEGDVIPEDGEPWLMTEGGMIPYLVQAIKELKAQFDAYVASHP